MSGIRKRSERVLLPLVIAALAVGLSACGGGGSSNVRPPSSPDAPDAPEPEVTQRPGRTMNEGGTIRLDGGGRFGSGSRALVYAWRQTAGAPQVELRDADTATPSFDAPNVAADVVLTFRMTATDADGVVQAVVVETVMVRGDNDAPTANAGTNLTVGEGGSVTLDGSGSIDPEGGALAFAWTQTGGPPTVILNGASTATPTFTAPRVTADADLTFRLTVTDSGGLSASDTVAVTVRAVNASPIANAGNDRSVGDGDSVALDGSGSSDPEGGALAFAWTQTGGSPRVTLSGARTATPTFTTPKLTANADLTFTLTVTDPGGLSASDTVVVTVRADNDAPSASAGANQVVTDGVSVTLDGGGSSDPEGGTLTYAWAQIGGTPTVTLGGESTARPTFTIGQLGSDTVLTFRLTVTDSDGLSASDTMTVTVRADNDAPSANAGRDVTVDEGDSVTLDGRGSSDPESGTLTYAWTQGGSPTVTLSGAATARPTFSAPQLMANADLTFTLTVTDPAGLSASDTVVVTVRADDDAPSANAGTDRTVNDGDSVTLDGSGSSDPESRALAYSWAQTGGSPTVTLSGAATARPTFSTPQLAAQADLTFTLTVTDPGDLSATDTVTITVRADNDPPSANAGADRTTYEGDSVTLDGGGSSDPEGGTLTYAWTHTGGSPTASLNGASTATATFTAPTVTADADLTFTLTVTDPGGGSATDTVTITVKNVRPAGSTVRTPPSGETLEPATAKSTASSWETAEYTASVGLPLINASTGYAARTMGNPGGGGITVAVIDGTVVTDHPDLPGATRVETGVARIIGTHGTRVAGVVAARRNGQGMHGVAYNANVVNMAPGSSGVGIQPAFASVAGLTGTYPGFLTKGLNEAVSCAINVVGSITYLTTGARPHDHTV